MRQSLALLNLASSTKKIIIFTLYTISITTKYYINQRYVNKKWGGKCWKPNMFFRSKFQSEMNIVKKIVCFINSKQFPLWRYIYNALSQFIVATMERMEKFCIYAKRFVIKMNHLPLISCITIELYSKNTTKRFVGWLIDSNSASPWKWIKKIDRYLREQGKK